MSENNISNGKKDRTKSFYRPRRRPAGYRIGNQHYVRVISSLTAQRVLSDPAFKLTMQYANLLGKASKIASAIYHLLPVQEHGFYRKLTGMAMQLLKQGKTGEEAFNNYTTILYLLLHRLKLPGKSLFPIPHLLMNY